MIRSFCVFAILLAGVAWADPDHDCQGGHNCNGGEVLVDSDVSTVVSHKSRAIGLAGGDVDIAQCYRSYSVLAGIWQDTRINPLCLADSYDAKGLHDLAAIVRCDVRAIRKHFASTEACIQANTIKVAIELPPEPIFYEREELEEEHAIMVQQQQVYIDTLEQRLERVERANKAAAQAAARKRQEDRDYAQALLEELSNEP